MSHQRQRHDNGMVRPQGRWGNQQNQQARFHPPPVHFLHGEIQRLHSLLDVARDRWSAENQKVACLEAELEETKLQLQKQKRLKEMHINMGKETKRELMRVEKFRDSATLDPAAISSIVYDDMKYKQKKLLQNDFVELKTAYIRDQEAFKAQIQAEKEKSNALQEELGEIKTSYEELRSKCEAGVAVVEQQDQQLLEKLRAEKDGLYRKMSLEIERLQEREKQTQSQLDQAEVSYQELKNRANQDLQLINVLRAEKDHLYRTILLEITQLVEEGKQTQSQLDQAEVYYQELNSKYEKEVSALNQQAETYQKEVDHEKKANLERAMKDLMLLDNMRAEKDRLQENMSKEITCLQEKERCLQSKMDEINVLYQELNSRYETEVSALKQQAEAFKLEIKSEKKAHLETENKNTELIKNLRAEKDDLQQKFTTEPQKMKAEVRKQTGVNTQLCGELKDEKDLTNSQRKIVGCEEPSLQNESIPEINLPEPASMDPEEVSEETLSEISEPAEISECTEVTPMDNKTLEELPKIIHLDPENMEDAGKGTKSNPLILENTPAHSGCEETKNMEEEQEHI
ncbi:MAR-binding filament-like protein 1 isoform X4 [Fundulus heteroclitus]|uniref:MAR-binding filament-like protein 1 isoform X2 n=1 Tax=Fundulus heteroclitus TaxID=8078 RepID=UPI00165C4144|nr:MAR-binding filament-like protein 1 isoform X2 [Fundulus heteroclitus]XP_021175184.2 MAR-binding filament-like protein 1 isoform X4 [Fundulus heteroclitus]